MSDERSRAWMSRATCGKVGPGFDRLTEWQQRRICDACPVRAKCVTYAASETWFKVASRESGGLPLYGGMTLGEIRWLSKRGVDLEAVVA